MLRFKKSSSYFGFFKSKRQIKLSDQASVSNGSLTEEDYFSDNAWKIKNNNRASFFAEMERYVRNEKVCRLAVGYNAGLVAFKKTLTLWLGGNIDFESELKPVCLGDKVSFFLNGTKVKLTVTEIELKPFNFSITLFHESAGSLCWRTYSVSRSKIFSEATRISYYQSILFADIPDVKSPFGAHAKYKISKGFASDFKSLIHLYKKSADLAPAAIDSA